MIEKEIKAELRKAMLAQRAALPQTEKLKLDSAFCSAIESIISERGAQVIHTYLPFGDEPDIYPLIQNLLTKNYKVICPKPQGKRHMISLELNSLSELEEGRFGTKHPANSKEYVGHIDLFIVPGVAFDKEGHRLGFGSGYYDTFFADHPSGYRLGVCYPFQIVDSFPVEAHDIPMNAVLY
jgi:5-formyltetrahydrofolate cyclo-ligase